VWSRRALNGPKRRFPACADSLSDKESRELLEGIKAEATVEDGSVGVAQLAQLISQQAAVTDTGGGDDELPRFEELLRLHCPGPPGRLSSLSIFHSKSVFYGGFHHG
jgi:hypothetical protein